jgi:hypothetical protein
MATSEKRKVKAIITVFEDGGIDISHCYEGGISIGPIETEVRAADGQQPAP